MVRLIEGAKVVIEWVHDDFSGPVNGMATYNDELVWFCRTNLPASLYCTTSTKNPREYLLVRPNKDVIEYLNSTHKKYSELSGVPLAHGDPYNLKYGSDVVNFSHGYDPNSIPGEKIGIIKETSFVNYYVPKEVMGGN